MQGGRYSLGSWGGTTQRRRDGGGVMAGRGTCHGRQRGTYVVLLPVKLQRVPQLGDLGLQIRRLLLLLRQPGDSDKAAHY